MATYQELLKQQAALSVQIEEARKREIADAVSRARQIVAEYGLTEKDVFPAGRRSPVAGHPRHQQGGAQIPRSRHRPDLDRARQAAEMDRGPRPPGFFDCLKPSALRPQGAVRGAFFMADRPKPVMRFPCGAQGTGTME